MSRSEDDDVTSGWGGVTSGHDLCELIGHVTCRDRSLLIVGVGNEGAGVRMMRNAGKGMRE